MIIAPNKTLKVTSLGSSYILVEDKLYFYFNIGNIYIHIGVYNNDIITANSDTRIGYSTLYGMIFVKGLNATPTQNSYLLLETGDYILLEDESKIIL